MSVYLIYIPQSVHIYADTGDPLPCFYAAFEHFFGFTHEALAVTEACKHIGLLKSLDVLVRIDQFMVCEHELSFGDVSGDQHIHQYAALFQHTTADIQFFRKVQHISEEGLLAVYRQGHYQRCILHNRIRIGKEFLSHKAFPAAGILALICQYIEFFIIRRACSPVRIQILQEGITHTHKTVLGKYMIYRFGNMLNIFAL